MNIWIWTMRKKCNSLHVDLHMCVIVCISVYIEHVPFLKKGILLKKETDTQIKHKAIYTMNTRS